MKHSSLRQKKTSLHSGRAELPQIASLLQHRKETYKNQYTSDEALYLLTFGLLVHVLMLKVSLKRSICHRIQMKFFLPHWSLN